MANEDLLCGGKVFEDENFALYVASWTTWSQSLHVLSKLFDECVVIVCVVCFVLRTEEFSRQAQRLTI